jgi:hypothetical protein
MKVFPTFAIAFACLAMLFVPASADGGIFGRAHSAGPADCMNGQCETPPAPAATVDATVTVIVEQAKTACDPVARPAANKTRREPLRRVGAAACKAGKGIVRLAAAPGRLIFRRR